MTWHEVLAWLLLGVIAVTLLVMSTNVETLRRRVDELERRTGGRR